MTLNHSAVDVFFHMTNHYRKLKRVKSAIDTSLPKGLRSRPRNNKSKSAKEASPTRTDQKQKSLERAPHYPSNARVTKNYSHSDDNEVKKTGKVIRSISLPPRPSTRRNPKDMPHVSPEHALSKGSKMKPNTQQKCSSPVFLKLEEQEQNCLMLKSSTIVANTNSPVNMNSDYAQALPVDTVPHGSHSGLRQFKMLSSQGVQPEVIKQRPSIPDHEYLQFALRITEDIIRNDLYSNEEMRRVFNSHIEANRGRLDVDKMNKQIEHLCMELNIPLRASKDFGALTRPELNRWRESVESREPVKHYDKYRIRCTEPFIVTTELEPDISKCADVITSQIVSDQKSDSGSDLAIFSKQHAVNCSLEPLTENTEPTTSHDTFQATLNSNQKSDTSISDFDQPVILPGLDDAELSSVRMNGFLVSVGIQTSKTSLSNKSDGQASTNKSEQTSEHSSKSIESSGSETKIFRNISSAIFPNSDKSTSKDDASEKSSKHSASIKIVGQNNIEEEFILVPGPIYVPKSAISYCRDTNNCTPTYSQVHQNANNIAHYPSLENTPKKGELTNRDITQSKINKCFENCEDPPKIVQRLNVSTNNSESQLNDVDLTPQREQREESSTDNSLKSLKDRSVSQHQCATCNEEKVCENDLIHSVPDRDVPSMKLLFGDDYFKPLEPYSVTLTPAIAKYFPTISTQTSEGLLMLDECYEVKNPEVQQNSKVENPAVEEKPKEEPEHKLIPAVKTLSFGHDVDGSLSMQLSMDQPDVYSEDMIHFSALQDGEQKSLHSLTYLKSLSSEKSLEKPNQKEDENADQDANDPKKTDLLNELDKAPSLTDSRSIEKNIMKVTTDWERFRQIEDNPMLIERQSSLKDLAEIMEKNFEKEEAQSQKLLEFMTEPTDKSSVSEEMSDLNKQPSEDNHVGCCGMIKKNKKKDKKSSDDSIHRLVDEKFSDTTIGSVSHAKSIRFEETDVASTRSSKSEQRIVGGSTEPNQNRGLGISKDYELQAQIREFSEALLKQRASLAGIPERFSYSTYTSDPSLPKHSTKEDDSDSSVKTPNSTVSMEDAVSVLRIKKLTDDIKK